MSCGFSLEQTTDLGRPALLVGTISLSLLKVQLSASSSFDREANCKGEIWENVKMEKCKNATNVEKLPPF